MPFKELHTPDIIALDGNGEKPIAEPQKKLSGPKNPTKELPMPNPATSSTATAKKVEASSKTPKAKALPNDPVKALPAPEPKPEDLPQMKAYVKVKHYQKMREKLGETDAALKEKLATQKQDNTVRANDYASTSPLTAPPLRKEDGSMNVANQGQQPSMQSSAREDGLNIWQQSVEQRVTRLEKAVAWRSFFLAITVGLLILSLAGGLIAYATLYQEMTTEVSRLEAQADTERTQQRQLLRALANRLQ